MLGVILLMTKKQLELSVATRNKKYSPTRSIGGEQSGADTGCSGTKIAQ